MNRTTLGSCPPVPKAVNKQSVLRQNMNHLREMHRIFQKEQIYAKSQIINPMDYVSVASKVKSSINLRKKQSNTQYPKNRRNVLNLEKKIRHRGVQTERPEDVPKLYRSGVLKFISPSIVAQFSKYGEPKDRGDHKNLSKNVSNVKGKKKNNSSPNTLQKGTNKKELEKQKIEDFQNGTLPGFVLLSDEEIKEYLRVARERYAPMIQQFNSMSISNDTGKNEKKLLGELRRLDGI